MLATYRSLIKKVNKEMKARAKRLRILADSTVLPKKKMVNIEEQVEKAIEELKKNPARILDWFTGSEIALYKSMEGE